MKNLLQGQLTIKQIFTGTKNFKNILPGLEPEKVENHWFILFSGIQLDGKHCSKLQRVALFQQDIICFRFPRATDVANIFPTLFVFYSHDMTSRNIFFY